MHNIPKHVGHYESSAKRKVHSTKCLHKEAGKSHISELTQCLKTPERKKQTHPGVPHGRKNQIES